MKKLFFLYTSLLLAVTVSAQLPDPVKFSYSFKKTGDKKYELHIVATIDDGWHLYSQTQPKQAVAKPTTIKLVKNPLINVPEGKAKEIGTRETYENKEVDIKQFQYAHKVEFVQSFTMKAAVNTNLNGTVTYQACTDERCLPVKTVPFELRIQQ